MNGVQFLSPAVQRMALQIEHALDQKVNVNGYMTFGSGGAFAVHYDPHDVLVMQVYGTKHWFIYDEPEPSPTDEEKKHAKKPGPRTSCSTRSFKPATHYTFLAAPIIGPRSPTRIRFILPLESIRRRAATSSIGFGLI